MFTWAYANDLAPRSYRCGHCGHLSGSNKGWQQEQGSMSSGMLRAFIYICSGCSAPTYFDPNGEQSPGITFGDPLEHLPPEVKAVYDEARECMSVSAFTAAVLLCRKLLMNVAHAQGANPGQPFISYVDYLEANHFTPPNAKPWVDHIRKKGNEATHEIAVMTRKDAEDLLTFSEMILKFTYELHGKLNPPPSSP